MIEFKYVVFFFLNLDINNNENKKDKNVICFCNLKSFVSILLI